jgi:hypothetical protein
MMSQVRFNWSLPGGLCALGLLLALGAGACGEELKPIDDDESDVEAPDETSETPDGEDTDEPDEDDDVPSKVDSGKAPPSSVKDSGKPPAVTPNRDAGPGSTPPAVDGDGAVPPDNTGNPPGNADDLTKFKDPGKEAWKVVPEAEVAEKCKLDVNLLKGVTLGSGFAVIRYGQLCFRKPATDAASQMFSATKTLGALVTGIASYETRDIPRSGAKTGQLKDSDKALHWLSSVSYNKEAHLAHVMAMVGHNATLTPDGSKRHSYDTVGSVQINSLSTMVKTAISQESDRLGTATGAFAKKFLFDKIGMTNSSWGGTQYATSWTSTLNDMARVGLLMIHQGVWAGERILDPGWVYKMTHPAFEDGNTAYGYLTWLVAKEGAQSIGGGSFTAGGGTGDTCAPSTLWQTYPHGLSTYKDCTYKTASCKQKYDVGSWSAQGLGGQFIVGHPGLDLVIVAKNYSGDGPAGMWRDIRPALVALDPMYKGNQDEFCKAYMAGDYAPDLVAQPVQPTD